MRVSADALEILRHQVPVDVLGSALRLVQADLLYPVRNAAAEGGHEYSYVVDSSPRSFAVQIRIEDDGQIDTRCGCSLPHPCPHVVAGCLIALSEREEAKRPSWQNELDAALDTRLFDDERCLFLTLREDKAQRHVYGEPQRRSGPYVAVRGGTRGTRGSWIKGQSSWSQLERAADSSRSAAALSRLAKLYQLGSGHGYYGYYPPDWLALNDLPGTELWSTLIGIRDAGVEIVYDDKAQTAIDLREQETAHVQAELVQHGDTLELAARTVIDGREPASLSQWVGSPRCVHAELIDDHDVRRATLRRAERPLPPVAERLLERDGAMRIHESERTAFLTGYLPRLQGALALTSPDDSVEIPPPPRPTLVLRLTHAVPQLHLGWEWDRPGGVRDRDVEGRILDAVRQAFGAQQELLSRPGGTPGRSVTTARAGEVPARTAGATPTGGSPAAGTPGTPGTPPDRTLGQASAVVFLTEVLPALREIDGLRIEENEQAPAYRAATSLPQVGIRSEGDGDWFDLHVTVTIDGEEVDFAALFTALTLDDPLFVLPSGTYFRLDAPELDQLRAILEEAKALTDKPSVGLRVSRYQVDLWQDLVELGIVAAQESAWWLAVQSLASGDVLEQVPPPHGLRAELREYQHAGLSWLHFLRVHGLGGVLADDMGLGKTLQVIAMIEIARQEDPDRPPFLVVAPTSVVGNWAAECAKFAPELRVTTISAMAGRKRGPLADEVRGSHVVVTSYALFRGEAEAYREQEWSGLILDEAQQIKNASSQGYKAARMLGAPFTVVVTGTPMENNLDELWALVSLAAPGLLGSRKQFTETYRRPIEKEHDGELLARLQRRLRPFLLRRRKDLVAAELPPKQEQVLEIDLHPKHRRLYDLHFQRERQKVLGLIDDVDANRFQIFRSLMKLRQLALDPALGDIGDAPSAKLDALIELLVEAADEGHRVLVLSQFTQFLGAARDRAAAAGLTYAYLDGSSTQRDQLIGDFRAGDAPVFFVSLRAGGFGLNLVEIDYVVLLDPWWNPAVEEQAIDRAHRIGQTRPVIVYRLVSRNTIEEKVIALREAKAALFARVFDGEGAVAAGALTADDIRGLLE